MKKTKKEITKDMNIIEVLKVKPKSGDYLQERGIYCVGCMAGQFETLEQGLKVHGFNSKEIKEIINEINKLK